jgi:hypothetical protein
MHSNDSPLRIVWTPDTLRNGLRVLVLVLVMLLLPSLIDPDYYWHVETGRLIVTGLTLPTADPFSFTRAGHPWVLHEWLFQVILYGFVAAIGPLGAKILTAALGTASVVLTYATMRQLLSRPIMAVCLAGLLYIVLSVFIVPRPQLFTYLFLAAYLHVLLSWKYRGDDRWLPALPLIMPIWANVHGGYMIGVALLAAFCGAEALSGLLRGSTHGNRGRIRKLAIVVVLTILASLINPYFMAHWRYPVEVLGLNATQDIGEWQSPSFHTAIGKLYLLVVAAFSFLQIYRKQKPDLTELAIPGLFIVSGFASIRHIVLAAMVMAVFAAAALRVGVVVPSLVPGVLQALRDWLRPLGRPTLARPATERLSLIVLLALCVTAVACYPVARAREDALIRKTYPVDSVQFIIRHGIDGRMFNSYGFGGYLIHELYPQQRVFIDGRADMYGDEFFNEYKAIAEAGRDWSQLFGKYQIDFVITERNEPIRELLLTRGDFRLVFEDIASSVLVRDSQQFAGIPSLRGP